MLSVVVLNVNSECHCIEICYAACFYAEHFNGSVIMLTIALLSVIMLRIITLYVVIQNVILLCRYAVPHCAESLN
jgi:hypothetical protein